MTDDKMMRAKRKLLRITFPNEAPFCYTSTTKTYIEALRRIGVEKLLQANLEICHLPLISQVIYPEYKDYMKLLVDGWYVNTQSDSETKYRHLISINNMLDLGIKIEIGSNLDTTEEIKASRSRRSPERIMVTFQDGTVVQKDTAQNTYIEAIKRIGPDKIRAKEINCLTKKLITPTEQYRGQVQLDSFHWLTVPTTTPLKIKMLNTISAIMKLNLRVEVKKVAKLDEEELKPHYLTFDKDFERMLNEKFGKNEK